MADLITTYSGASHFADNVNFEVQRQGHFEIDIDLSTLRPPLGNGDDYQKHIRLSCTEAKIPELSVASVDLRHGNEKIKVAGSPDFKDISIKVYDTIGMDMVGLLQEWFHRIFNPVTHTMGLVTTYKTSARLYLYSPDATVIRKWEVFGVFPTNLSFGELSYDNSGSVITISIDLAVDKALESIEQK